MKLLIVADDFTGASDTGVQLAKQHIKTLVAVGPDGEAGESCDVLSVNIDTRHELPGYAFQKVKSLLKRFSHVPNIYLKTDSVLRGNLSASFFALLGNGRGPVMFVPAYPKSGRITTEGRQFVNGLPLDVSPFSRDPLNPMTTCYIPDILAKTHAVSSLIIHEGQSVPDYADKNKVYIFDCTSQERLMQITAELKRTTYPYITAGCAGFAEVLPELITFEKEETGFIPNSKPVLFLSGSVNELTFIQLVDARERGITVLTIPAGIKGLPLQETYSQLESLTNQLGKRLRDGNSVVLATAEKASDLKELPGVDSHVNLGSLFAQVASQLIQSGMVENLAIFGGDTAQAVLTQLGCGCVRALLEIQPGVPLSVSKNLHIVTKSGGLGAKNAVNAIEKAMRG